MDRREAPSLVLTKDMACLPRMRVMVEMEEVTAAAMEVPRATKAVEVAVVLKDIRALGPREVAAVPKDIKVLVPMMARVPRDTRAAVDTEIAMEMEAVPSDIRAAVPKEVETAAEMVAAARAIRAVAVPTGPLVIARVAVENLVTTATMETVAMAETEVAMTVPLATRTTSVRATCFAIWTAIGVVMTTAMPATTTRPLEDMMLAMPMTLTPVPMRTLIAVLMPHRPPR